MKIQHGGEERIESLLMNVEYHGEEELHLETSYPIPFILLKESSMIVSINKVDDSFTLLQTQIETIRKSMNKAQEIYNNFTFYDNRLLNNLDHVENKLFYRKESFLSFSLMMYIFLFGDVKIKIQNIDDFMMQLKKEINHTPLYYCMERMMHDNFGNRFLLLI